MTQQPHHQGDASRLGRYIKQLRQARGLSYEGLARAAGMNRGNLYRLEHGEPASPDPRVLQNLARALEVELADLYIEAGLPLPQQLPSMAPYLRAKYDLPDAAIAQIAEYVDMLNERYGEGKEADHDDTAA